MLVLYDIYYVDTAQQTKPLILWVALILIQFDIYGIFTLSVSRKHTYNHPFAFRNMGIRSTQSSNISNVSLILRFVTCSELMLLRWNLKVSWQKKNQMISIKFLSKRHIFRGFLSLCSAIGFRDIYHSIKFYVQSWWVVSHLTFCPIVLFPYLSVTSCWPLCFLIKWILHIDVCITCAASTLEPLSSSSSSSWQTSPSSLYIYIHDHRCRQGSEYLQHS